MNVSNRISINPQTINNHFRDFYSALYTSECSLDEAHYQSSIRILRFFLEKISSLLLSTFKEAYEFGVPPLTMQQTTISLLGL